MLKSMPLPEGSELVREETRVLGFGETLVTYRLPIAHEQAALRVFERLAEGGWEQVGESHVVRGRDCVHVHLQPWFESYAIETLEGMPTVEELEDSELTASTRLTLTVVSDDRPACDA